MVKRLTQLTFLLLLLLAGTFSVYLRYQHDHPDLSAENFEAKEQRDKALQDRDAALQQKVEADKRTALAQAREAAARKEAEAQKKRAEEFKLFVQHLKATRWAAEVYVKNPTHSASVSGGIQSEWLDFREYDDQHHEVFKKKVWIEGKRACLAAQVIKFDSDLVAAGNDPLHSESVVVFRCLHGFKESQSMEAAFENPLNQLHPENVAPPVYSSADPKVIEFQQKLWSQFWTLAKDPQAAKSLGVRVAQGESPWTEFEPGYKYEISIDANGGLNITPVKLDPVVAENFDPDQQNTEGGHEGPTTAPTTNVSTSP